MTAAPGEGGALRDRVARLPDDKRARLLRQLRGRPYASQDEGSWFVRYSAADAPVVRLFCFPYAGGGGSVFRTWSEGLPAGVELWAAQLPGRESRVTEPALRQLDPLVESLYEAVLPRLDLPYAFFGHSMGALVAFELTRRLRRAGAPQPSRLLLAAFRAPQLPNPNIRIHHMPDEVLRTVLRKEGTPPEVLDNGELMRALLPMLRADFELCDTYRYRDEPPLPMPVSVFGGDQDVRVSRSDLDMWRSQAGGKFRLVMLPGSHFFLHSSQDLLLAELSRELEAATARTEEGERCHD
ncbi:thioesterase II family protein [Streptomyces africanus]|uniref:thioesterase II family protein n=1 Tax=Streptomyces africanus TaxID=231024 RepID=UPI000A37AD75|nr:alpha/beta fold hydrolase [Streptomyces africanus]